MAAEFGTGWGWAGRGSGGGGVSWRRVAPSKGVGEGGACSCVVLLGPWSDTVMYRLGAGFPRVREIVSGLRVVCRIWSKRFSIASLVSLCA